LKNLSDGKQYCEMKPVYVQPMQPDPENPRYLKIASFIKEIRPIDDSADPWRSFYTAELPEIVGHGPLMGEFSARHEMSVNAKPAKGPAGCVLVETLRRDHQERKLVGRRAWIDPARGYLIMLDETLSGTRVNHTVSQAAEIVDAAQSPSGYWYPTRLRMIGGGVSLDTGEKSDYFNNYYLDFDAEVPDSLFEIPR
jgi:hypothetical protein